MIRIRPKSRVQMRLLLVAVGPLILFYPIVAHAYSGLKEGVRDVVYLWNKKKFD